ncbi:hypothetical protein CRG98_018330 [Punica granatum]|uniref:Uncharacterized protein n=1 Tax=Punica granatum TaxID=22663 RepID=A0A2I0K0M3_PUNGR|nr:hypothetical protein CRG98_018330 [Punica granatum]
MTVPVYAWFSVFPGEPLTRDGGPRYKGVNSLKSSEDLWGPIRWHSRLDPFPYSEPLTNRASYLGARGISDKSDRVVTGIPGGFPVILAGFGLGTGWTRVWGWVGV